MSLNPIIRAYVRSQLTCCAPKYDGLLSLAIFRAVWTHEDQRSKFVFSNPKPAS